MVGYLSFHGILIHIYMFVYLFTYIYIYLMRKKFGRDTSICSIRKCFYLGKTKKVWGKMEFSFISNFHGHVYWPEELFLLYVYICGIGTWAIIDFLQVGILLNNISSVTDNKVFNGPCICNPLLLCQSLWSVMRPQGHCSLPFIGQYLTWEFVKKKKLVHIGILQSSNFSPFRWLETFCPCKHMHMEA